MIISEQLSRFLNNNYENISGYYILREVCIRKVDEEKFLLHVKNGSEVRLDKPRRVSVDTSCGMKDVDAHASAVTRSFICAAPNPMLCEEPSLLFSKLRLMRVLDVYETEFGEFPREIYQLVNVRYLAVSCKSGGIPTGISTLRYLQTLIARVEAGHFVPSEIWEISELNHLKLDAIICIAQDYMIKFVRKKLQTLYNYVWVTDPLMRRGFFESIPNIKKLGVYFDELASSSEVVDLTHLHKLQTLRCWDSDLNEDSGCRFLLQKLRFPSSLRKLNLFQCVIFGRFMTTLCALPNLEVLKITRCVFEDNEEWEAAEGDEFKSLLFLQFINLKVVRWRADETNFPRLRELIIYDCRSLEEIPSGIGEIPTLQLIQLYKCSPSAVASAKQIQELQQSEFDNYDLRVEVASSSEVVDLTHLHKLQTLRCDSELYENGCRFLLQKLIFPSSLRKLRLYECVIFGRFMTSLCALPNLEVLRINKCVFEDNEEWEAAEGDEFRSLQFLQFANLKLVRWRADETNFPRLEKLSIGDCPSLEEIPSGIGEIPTLQRILLYKCRPSVVASAKQIQELQQSEFDNYHLQVLITYIW